MASTNDLDIARRAFFDTAPEPIALTETRTGLVRAANAAFVSLFDLPRGDVVGRDVVDLGLWNDAGQRNSFLNCLAIEGRLTRYPLPASPRFCNSVLHVSAEPVSRVEEDLLLMRLDVVPASSGDQQPGGVQFLSRATMDFFVDDNVGLQTRIVRELHAMVPNSLVFFAAFDPEYNELTLRARSTPVPLEAAVSKGLERYVDGRVARLGESDRSRILNCDLRCDTAYSPPTTVTPGSNLASVPYGALAAELGVDSIWHIAFAWEGEIFGLVSILLRAPDTMSDRALVETFVLQASAALQRNRHAQALNSALSEKETLLREIHHRVKNNLQIIASLLNLQTDRTEDPIAIRALLEAADRVQSMALVHTMLYSSKTLCSIDAAEYLRTLALQIVRGAAAETFGVELRFNLENLVLDTDRAVPVGLIVNELVTNALKYGVGIPGPGVIELTLKRVGNLAEIVVSDSGGRLPRDFRPEDAQSLGMQLVVNLAGQLGGTVGASVGEATLFRIHFPL